MEYFVKVRDEEFGPYSLKQVLQHISAGEILPTDFARTEEMEEWVLVSKLMNIGDVRKFKATSAPRIETNLTQEFRAYMTGEWESSRSARLSTNVVKVEDFVMEFERGGVFKVTVSVNSHLQTMYAGKWLVVPISSESFTLKLNCAGQDPTSSTIRLIDQDSFENCDNGCHWLRVGSSAAGG